MTKLLNYVSKGELSIMVMLGTVTSLMTNAAKYYQDKGRSDWARKLKCASTYAKNVMDDRYDTLDDESKVLYNRRYKKTHLNISCTDADRFSPETQDDEFVTIETKNLYHLAEALIDKQCKSCQKCGQEVQDCEYRKIMMMVAIPVSENKSECPFNDGSQSVQGAMDNERKFLKSKLA